jgi:hypothetical protein
LLAQDLVSRTGSASKRFCAVCEAGVLLLEFSDGEVMGRTVMKISLEWGDAVGKKSGTSRTAKGPEEFDNVWPIVVWCLNG